jgi:hypothetical protein
MRKKSEIFWREHCGRVSRKSGIENRFVCQSGICFWERSALMLDEKKKKPFASTAALAGKS